MILSQVFMVLLINLFMKTERAILNFSFVIFLTSKEGLYARRKLVGEVFSYCIGIYRFCSRCFLQVHCIRDVHVSVDVW